MKLDKLEKMDNIQKFFAVDLIDRIFSKTYEDYQSDFRQGDYSEESENAQAQDIFNGWKADMSKVPTDMRPGEFVISLIPVAREMLRSKVDVSETIDLITPNKNEYQIIMQMLDGTIPMNLNALSPEAKSHAENFIDRISSVYHDESPELLSHPAWGTLHGQIVRIIEELPSKEIQKEKGINKTLLYGGAAAVIALLIS